MNIQSFLANSSILVKTLYIIVWILAIAYFTIKYKKKNYIFSIFNISIIFTSIIATYLVIGPLQYNNQAWHALGVSQSQEYIYYLNKTLTINLIGCIILFVGLMYFEFKNSGEQRELKIIERISDNISKIPILIINIALIVTWYGIIFMTIKTLPLFGHRTFALEYGLQTVYNILNISIAMMSLYYLSKYILDKNKLEGLLAIINLLTLMFTGNRATIIFVPLNMFVLFMYLTNSNPKKITIKIICVIGIALILGIGMDFIRKGDLNIGITNIIENIAYGNTFSDIRDGAFVLNGFENRYDSFLYGKNYIADILAFIPKSVLEFREIWSYGMFSTKTLFGWEGHYGLRGGYFLESYINFGYVGVIIFSIAFAYILSFLEKQFYFYIVQRKNNYNLSIKLVMLDMVNTIAGGIMISSGIANIYPQVIIFIGILILSFLLKKYNEYNGILKGEIK